MLKSQPVFLVLGTDTYTSCTGSQLRPQVPCIPAPTSLTHNGPRQFPPGLHT